ncbi:MAG: tRNA preQ1(34) S-adenosylmethionine ribosyltransferase-isomerase QueA [Patescibacteria group bacterium]
MYQVSDFDYYLPPALIAQEPAKPRDHSRLLLLDKKTGKVEHDHFYNLIDHLRPGDLLVLNNSKVFPARLLGRKELTGGAVEIFLHRQLSVRKSDGNVWECLVGGRAKEGVKVDFSRGLQATILKNNNNGTWQVGFNLTGDKFWRAINQIGLVPLPPYIKRNKKMDSDKSSYQTVFADARKVGSVAAPTAGLHFTKSLLKKIKARGVKIVAVTLHVGLGTFAPVKTEKISEHKMHSEFASVGVAAVRAIIKTKETGGRVIAVGTTSCRTLESLDLRQVRTQSFWTDIFIYPGYRFKVVDALVTNFHLPKSSLLMLVSALAGKGNIDLAYRQALSQKYRFFSYGDAMFIY